MPFDDINLKATLQNYISARYTVLQFDTLDVELFHLHDNIIVERAHVQL